ncbi:hypothetical protein CHGG_10586 [Chaetomium globosum CBS 148.51]|uniref:Reverse transcriptase domain-containing protein n=1 Tax=Chaetomium globosum (strain ATCC 6205 / CBS 148.51 / DSM 1962 / NBRC 6347 / NRRL 1970) TaxID=306901 RepID=Q2GN68_CHAGB|nr:uncharacterized protein CHGG_10586 [Chaetomium globosum CBS 148.51]EAQ84182.1 hypothetical protein CHGG_10586 [Chaetomium globosum CBS 148.51]
MYDASQSQTGNISLANLRKVVAEEVKAAVNGAGTQDKGTWAAVAAHRAVPPQSQPNTPTKIVPTRINKEILVRGRGMPADLAKRTPQETIQAVNQVSVKKGAVAARRLPSGDTIVTFQSAGGIETGSFDESPNWIKGGFWRARLKEEQEEPFAVLLIRRVEERTSKRVYRGGRKATRSNGCWSLLTSQEEARKACDEGVIWRAQLLDCEPYWAALSPTQCYKCWKWGHTQHYCKATPLCPRCGTKAHGEGGREGEAQCPTHKNEISLRCPACGGRHPAWSGECPEKSKVLAKAKEAYQFRPRTYETATTISAITTHTSAPTFSFGAEEREDDSYQVVGRTRLRGRSTNVAATQRQALLDPQQTRIDFEAPRVRFASPVVSGVDTTAPPPRAPEPATGPTPTAAANPAVTATPDQRDAEGDTTMDSITQTLEVLLEEAKYDLLAVQEPWINKATKSTYCPRSSRYHLVHKLEGRAAIYVSKRFEIRQWDSEATENWCRVWFPEADLGGESRGFELWSVYNPPAGENVPRALQGRPRPSHPVVLAGDFNLKNPLWDGFGRYDRKSEDLLQLGSLWDLTIRTPRGATTRAPQGRQRGRPSTIDHFWTSENPQTVYYGEECRGKSDHYPQVLEVGEGHGPRPTQPDGWAWKKMDRERVKAESELLCKVMGLADPGPDGLPAKTRTVEGLDKAFDSLVEWLTWVAKESTPRKKASCGYSSPWWTVEVQQAAREARRAERLAKETRAEYCWEELSERLKDLARTTREARTRAWRNSLQEASEAKKPDQMWSLERWARLRSFLPPEPPRLPEFKDSSGQVTAETHDQKASALAERFFPDPPANLTDVEDQAFLGSWNPGFDVVQAVTPIEITEAMGRASPWKAPGEDLLPMGLLKACGAPLAEVLALLATRCLELGWFPSRFKRAKTVVLPKPGKAPPAYQTPGGYRPIALLPTLGKVIESVVARKVTQAAEVNGLLPDEQMGNRAHRSTELAVRLVVAQVQEAWRQKGAASLLQLDISGAFDTVNHTRLLATLREMGFPRWLVLWTRDWLTGREATLLFDGKTAAPTAIRAGVLQGSPLSPVLFILYISSLYKQLKDEQPHLAITGFADDTNLLVFGRNPEANVRQLEAAWETCIRWADSRGMKFAPEKSELIHFNKGRRQWTEQVNLANPGGGTSPVKPEESARFLGVWLDWKLNWKAHLVAVEKKLRTQSYALSRIVAKTWGMGLAKAREVYTKCIRSALAYGASSFHIPTDVGGEPVKKGITKALGKAQNKSLRIVAGAFKSTPIRNLETETWVPPLDLYLNKRLADFETRLQRPDLDDGRGGKKTAASVVLTACRKIQQRLSSRRGNRGRPRTLGPQGPTAVERAAGTVMRRTGGTVDTNRVVEEAWKARWLKERDGRAITRPADDFDHQQETLFRNGTLRRHDGLSKAKSWFKSGREQ